MKLAEALIKKADLTREIAEVKEQLLGNLFVPNVNQNDKFDDSIKSSEILEIEKQLEEIQTQLKVNMLDMPTEKIVELGLRDEYQKVAVPLIKKSKELNRELDKKLMALSMSKTTVMLFDEYESLNITLKDLVVKISRANAKGESEGELLSELLAQRQWLMTKHAFYKAIFAKAKNEYSTVRRYDREDSIRTIDLGALHKTISNIAQQIRILDVKIQKANWEIDID